MSEDIGESSQIKVLEPVIENESGTTDDKTENIGDNEKAEVLNDPVQASLDINTTKDVVSVNEVVQQDLKVDESPPKSDKAIESGIVERNVSDDDLQSNVKDKHISQDVSDGDSDYKDAEIIPNNSGVEDKEGEGSISEGDGGDSGSSAEDLSYHRRRRTSTEESKGNESDSESVGKSDLEEDVPAARESGDGEEKVKDKPLDKDEDKKDPQYIPKKGMFYEHDDRTYESTETPTVETSKEKKKKKVVADKIDRWGHDMFDKVRQTPKSTQDLIDYYGYDIRNEEEPPKAWRSRRYGRGPNRYTRQWQDEAAYKTKRRPAKSPRPFKQKQEEFPTVEESAQGNFNKFNRKPNYPSNSGSRRGRNNSSGNRNRSLGRKNLQNIDEGKGDTSHNFHEKKTNNYNDQNTADEYEHRETKVDKNVLLNKKKALPAFKTKTDAEADIAALSREFSNAVINVSRDGKILPMGTNFGINNSTHVVANEGNEPKKEMKMDQGGVADSEETNKDKFLRQEPQPVNKSKRYSTQRQRSLPQSNHIQQQPPPPPPQQQTQQFIHQQQFFSPPSNDPEQPMYGGYSGQNPPVYPDSMQSVVFLPPQYPPPPPHLINYGLPAPQQYGMPLAPPPPDMYSNQPGITYYSPQTQVSSRPNTSRRVKVAIPIVPPPDQQDSAPCT